MRFKVISFFFPILIWSLPGYHQPWGKDGDLSYNSSSTPIFMDSSLMADFMKKVISFHQHIISPIDGPRSHFKPSSSNYMLQAICKHGFLKGYLLGCNRLLRENSDPWYYRTLLWEDDQIWKIDLPPDE